MSKVIELPPTNEQQFSAAIRALREGKAGEALTEARRLIDKGYPHAYTLAGAACEKGGIDLRPNPADALFYYKKAVDEVGALEAWLALGRMYYFGRGIEPDYKQAFYCYSTVYNETKNGLAAMMLARCYAEGRGVEVNNERAITYLTEAARGGFALASTYLASIEFRSGRYAKALGHWLHGIWRAFRLPKGDTKLRPY